MAAGAVANTLGQLVGQQFSWLPGKSSLLEESCIFGPMRDLTYAFSCYEFPFLGARRASIALDRIIAVSDGLIQVLAGQAVPNNAFAGGLRSYNNYGVWQWIWWQNTPLAGDFVLFSGANARYSAHVAIATGVGYDTVTFGHNAISGLPAAQALPVQNLTVDQIFALNPALTTAHFLTPIW
ncbi:MULTISPECIES: hypothetical protein [Pseudomonas]|uniref:hypothetical protein n=1 Tax=Pseudomonas TaxID=286 RepID=UPI00209F46CF|nr:MULTISPECIES: hypothetical protein [Pseudomonas]MCP1456981.1 hypothetical protein [Pseudomonas kilonensis]UVM59604.1 hypothetical protein LOY50_18805 [Pseudomonas sp. B21-010]